RSCRLRDRVAVRGSRHTRAVCRAASRSLRRVLWSARPRRRPRLPPAGLSRPPRCNPPESASRGSRFSPSTIALASRPVQLSAVMATELVDLLEREGVELYYPGLGAERGWHNAARFIPAPHLYDDPCPVLPVHAAPLGTSQEVGPGPQEDFGGSGALGRLVVVRDLNEESCH